MNPWQWYKIKLIRKVGHQVGVKEIGGVELQTNWSMIRVEHRLKELICTKTGGRVAVVSIPMSV